MHKVLNESIQMYFCTTSLYKMEEITCIMIFAFKFVDSTDLTHIFSIRSYFQRNL